MHGRPSIKFIWYSWRDNKLELFLSRVVRYIVFLELLDSYGFGGDRSGGKAGWLYFSAMFEISRDLHFRTFYTSDYCISDHCTSDNCTSECYTSDTTLWIVTLRTLTLWTITLQTITLRTTALCTTALRTTMSEQDTIIHPCPFPLCKSRPFSWEHSLKNRLGTLLLSCVIPYM